MQAQCRKYLLKVAIGRRRRMRKGEPAILRP